MKHHLHTRSSIKSKDDLSGPRYCAVASAALLFPLLASCAAAPLETSIADAQATAEEWIGKKAPSTPSRPLVTVHDGPYLADTRIAHSGALWLHENVEIRAAGLPFDLCLAKALEQLNDPPSVVLAADIAPREAEVTLDHQGPFRDFLNLLAEASGFGWEKKAGALHWMAEVTRTFDIHRVPGDLAYSMNTVQSSREQVVQSGGGGGGSGGVRATPEAGGNINLNVGSGFWESLDETLVRLLGAGNPPIIDRTTGTVVVRGPAGRVREAARHIQALNAWLARQVLLEIQLVTVTLSEDHTAGIDWNLVHKSVTAIAGSSDFAQASARALGITPASIGLEFGEPFLQQTENPNSRGTLIAESIQDPSPFEGTSILLRALQAQGETSVVNSPRLVALNGQAAQLQVLNDKGILAGVDVITRETAALATEVQLEPGVVSTGISLTILPKIVGDRVFLHANILVSDLAALDSAGSQGQSIQLPTVNRSQFFQSARLRSGETLALGGLSADRGAKEQQTIARFSWLGAKSRRFSRTETVLLITPTLLDPPAPDEDLLR